MFEEEKDNKIYNLLISRGESKSNDHKQFYEKLYSKTDFLWKESVAASYSHMPESFFNKIDVIIILSGVYNNNKDEIDDIINASKHYNIPIVLIRPYGVEEVPENLESIATTIIGWNANCIVDEIKNVVNGEYDELDDY